MLEKERLEQLFKKHYGDMYRLARILLHDDAESKDIVSDVFVKLLDGTVCLKEESEKAFLLTCVRNRCLNKMRRMRLQERVSQLYLLDMATDIAPLENTERDLEELRKVIDTQLTPKSKTVLLLHYRDNLTYVEIAQKLQISDVAVYKHLRNAMEKLRKHFKTIE